MYGMEYVCVCVCACACVCLCVISWFSLVDIVVDFIAHIPLGTVFGKVSRLREIWFLNISVR